MSQRLPSWPDLAPLEPVLEAASIVGLFEWDIATDRIFPCLGMARIFGLDPSTIREGAPSSAFVQALHPNDRAAFSDRTGSGRGHIEQKIYRVANAGTEPTRTILECSRLSFDRRGAADWACGALFDYPGAKTPTMIVNAHQVLAVLDRAAGVAVELRRTIQEVENPNLHALVDMVMIEIAASIARQIERPEAVRLN